MIQNRKNKIINKWALIVGVPLITFGAPFLFGQYNSNFLSTQLLLSIAGSLFTTLIMWFGTMTIVRYLWKNFPWEKNPLKHLVIEVIAILTYTFLVGAIFYSINEIYPIESFEKNLKLSIFFNLIITFFITSLTEGYFFFMKWKETLVQTEKLEKENIRSQYETLKSQINPHFLFNNLNTLSSLIEENPKVAVDYVQKTADYYRSILNLKDKEIISIGEELELIKTFYNLQSNRYGDNLKLIISIPHDVLIDFVAPLTLQMLVENSIKHNIISKDKPLTIKISSNDECIIVSNNLQKRDLESTSNKIGLKNISDRYSFLTNKKVKVTENETTFTVSIPILKCDMNVLIVEDEAAAARRLAKMLGLIDPKTNVLATTDSITTTLEWLRSNDEPELILMDIHLADGSSFKIFDQIKIKCPIIFTTAFDQYAIQAFKVNSIDYLLKPIKQDELAFSLNKFKTNKTEKSSTDIEKLLAELRKPQLDYQQRFVVQFAEKLKSIEVNSIAYFIALEKSVFMVTLDNHRYAIDYTLEKLDEILNPKVFHRINRKFIVNFSAIKGMFTYSKSRVKIELYPNPETEVIVTSERASGFKDWLNQ